ncbi:MAG: Vps62-related protein [Planctomycetes bacterium]|nr:Vps62-related protein [Planctomycetota bacterium]
MLQRTSLVLGLLILSGCTIGRPAPLPPRETADVSEDDVKLMIARFGPVIYLRDDEAFVMDDPEYILDHGTSLCWGIVDDASYSSFGCTGVRSKPTSSETLLDDVRAAGEVIRSTPDAGKYKCWLNINDAWKAGNLNRAKALVRVLPSGKHWTEIQFWFFYPFNGPGRVRIRAASRIGDDNWLRQCGRHYGDWELVSIIVSNTATELVSVYMSRHSGGEVFHQREDGTYRSASRPGVGLEIEGPGFLQDMYKAHPIVYSAISSHAHYPSAGNHYYERVFSQRWGLGTASADLFDRTEAGRPFRTYEPGRYRIISSDLPNVSVDEPRWLDFDGRWGQYEKLSDKIHFGAIPTYTYEGVGKGPTGPKKKAEWMGAFR